MNDNRNGGPFSDEYEAPKRENPYLKKNRGKTKAERTKGEGRRADGVDSPYVAVEDRPAYAAPSAEPIPAHGAGYTHRRTFSDWIFEHVKLIASVSTAAVILALLLLVNNLGWLDDVMNKVENGGKNEITLTYVKGLAEKSDPIHWTDFQKFRYKESKADDSVTWKLAVKDTAYEVWVTGADTAHAPMAVWIIDWNSGDRMTLGEDDLDEFLAEHTKK
jgi:hypothetical protein